HRADSLGRVSENCALCVVALSHPDHPLSGERFQRHAAVVFWAVLDVPGGAIYSGSKQPEAAAGLLESRTCRPHLRWHWHEYTRDYLRRAPAHGLSRVDQAGAL